jgi:hypothetical protein
MQHPHSNNNENSASFPTKSVQIRSGSIPLSKEQLEFNRLTRRIEKLQKQIPDETKKLQDLNNLYQNEVYSKVLELGKLKIDICHLLDQKRTEIKLPALQNQKLDHLLLDFLDDAFSVIEPDDATKELYKKYSRSSYEDELSNQESAVKEVFSDMLFKKFGLRLDPSMLTQNPDFARIEEELKKQWEQKERLKKTKRKTKKQLEKEELEQQKEALKNKSIRSIYVALAKILHPDTEPDEALKQEKEEMMKQVTVAYENRDLMQLLQLEMQWIKKHDDSLSKMEASTLNVYIHLLKDQVKELEQELDMLYVHPAFSAVSAYSLLNTNEASREIIAVGKTYRALNNKLQSNIHQLEHGTKTYAAIMQCIKEYYTLPGGGFMDEDGPF